MSFFDQKNINSFVDQINNGNNYRVECMRSIGKPLYIFYENINRKNNNSIMYENYNKSIKKGIDNEVIIVYKKLCDRYKGDSLFDEYLQKICLKEVNDQYNKEETDIDYIILYVNGEFNGILIAKKNECNNKYRVSDIRSTFIKPDDYWSVKLICSQGGGHGKILMALYLDTLINIGQDYGLLELAQGYANIAGYCSYRSFGFKENENLICDAYDIPSNVNNLKMTCDTSDLTRKKLLKVIKDNEYKISYDPVCKKGLDKEKQLEMLRNLQTEYENKIIKFRKQEKDNVIRNMDKKTLRQINKYISEINPWNKIEDFDYIKQILETGVYIPPEPEPEQEPEPEPEPKGPRRSKRFKAGFGKRSKKKSKRSKKSRRSNKKSKRSKNIKNRH